MDNICVLKFIQYFEVCNPFFICPIFISKSECYFLAVDRHFTTSEDHFTTSGCHFTISGDHFSICFCHCFMFEYHITIDFCHSVMFGSHFSIAEYHFFTSGCHFLKTSIIITGNCHITKDIKKNCLVPETT